MPELPEVRVVSKSLSDKVKKKVIKSIEIYRPKMIKDIDSKEFKKTLIGQEIKDVTNYGKFIIFNFKSGLIMLSHLRMEGKYFFYKNLTNKNKHDHIVFEFTDGTFLHYQDTRVFGTFHLKTTKNYLTTKPLMRMGPEPSKINFEIFKEKILKRKTTIKTVLLDQTTMAGLGNIYVDEVLFASKINPTRGAFSMTNQDLKNILKYSISIMDKSTTLGGSSISSYTSLNKQEGQYQNFLKVHTKKNSPCPNCKTTILKIKVNGRGTYYCSDCQK
jgi:formamidopyrimidine-DNA glycosylase